MTKDDKFDVKKAYRQIITGCAIRLKRCVINDCFQTSSKIRRLSKMSDCLESADILENQNDCLTPLLLSSPSDSEDEDAAVNCQSTLSVPDEQVTEKTVLPGTLCDRLKALCDVDLSVHKSSSKAKEQHVPENRVSTITESEENIRFSKRQTCRKSTYRPSAAIDQMRKETLERVKMKTKKPKRRNSAPGDRKKSYENEKAPTAYKSFKNINDYKYYSLGKSKSHLKSSSTSKLYCHSKESGSSDSERYDIKPQFEVPQAAPTLPNISIPSLPSSPQMVCQAKSINSPQSVLPASYISGISKNSKDFPINPSNPGTLSALKSAENVGLNIEITHESPVVKMELESAENITLPVTINYGSRPLLNVVENPESGKHQSEDQSTLNYSVSVPNFGPSITVSLVQPADSPIQLTDQKNQKLEAVDAKNDQKDQKLETMSIANNQKLESVKLKDDVKDQNLSPMKIESEKAVKSESVKIKNEPIDLINDEFSSPNKPMPKVGLIKVRAPSDLGITNTSDGFSHCILPTSPITSLMTSSCAAPNSSSTTTSDSTSFSVIKLPKTASSSVPALPVTNSGLPRDPRIINKSSAPILQAHQAAHQQNVATLSSSLPPNQLDTNVMGKRKAATIPNPKVQIWRTKIDNELRKLSEELSVIFKEWLKAKKSQKTKLALHEKLFSKFQMNFQSVINRLTQLTEATKDDYQKTVQFYIIRLLSYAMPDRALNNEETAIFMSLLAHEEMLRFYSRSVIFDALSEREKQVSKESQKQINLVRQNFSLSEPILQQNISGLNANANERCQMNQQYWNIPGQHRRSRVRPSPPPYAMAANQSKSVSSSLMGPFQFTSLPQQNTTSFIQSRTIIPTPGSYQVTNQQQMTSIPVPSRSHQNVSVNHPKMASAPNQKHYQRISPSSIPDVVGEALPNSVVNNTPSVIGYNNMAAGGGIGSSSVQMTFTEEIATLDGSRIFQQQQLQRIYRQQQQQQQLQQQQQQQQQLQQQQQQQQLQQQQQQILQQQMQNQQHYQQQHILQTQIQSQLTLQQQQLMQSQVQPQLGPYQQQLLPSQMQSQLRLQQQQLPPSQMPLQLGFQEHMLLTSETRERIQPVNENIFSQFQQPSSLQKLAQLQPPRKPPLSVPYINSSQSPSPGVNNFDSIGRGQTSEQPVSVNVVQSTSRTSPENVTEPDLLRSKEADKADYEMYQKSMDLLKEFYKATMSQFQFT